LDKVIGDWEDKDVVVMGLGEVETCGICVVDARGVCDIGIDDCEDKGCEELTCGGVVVNKEAVRGPYVIIIECDSELFKLDIEVELELDMTVYGK
jgi:hypothetical protein